MYDHKQVWTRDSCLPACPAANVEGSCKVLSNAGKVSQVSLCTGGKFKVAHGQKSYGCTSRKSGGWGIGKNTCKAVSPATATGDSTKDMFGTPAKDGHYYACYYGCSECSATAPTTHATTSHPIGNGGKRRAAACADDDEKAKEISEQLGTKIKWNVKLACIGTQCGQIMQPIVIPQHVGGMP